MNYKNKFDAFSNDLCLLYWLYSRCLYDNWSLCYFLWYEWESGWEFWYWLPKFETEFNWNNNFVKQDNGTFVNSLFFKVGQTTSTKFTPYISKYGTNRVLSDSSNWYQKESTIDIFILKNQC